MDGRWPTGRKEKEDKVVALAVGNSGESVIMGQWVELEMLFLFREMKRGTFRDELKDPPFHP